MQIFTRDSYTLTWEEHSPGDETFILIPGHANVRSAWEHVIAQLAPLGRWVSLDLIGHYPATLAPTAHITPEQLAALYAPVIREIANQRPVTLVGHSTGGLVVLATAAHMPGEVQRVIALSSVVWGQLHGFLGFMQWLLRQRCDALFSLTARSVLAGLPVLVGGASLYAHKRITFVRSPITWETFRRTYPWARRLVPRNLALVLRLLETWDIRALVEELPIPVLACTGVCDPIVPATQSLWLAEHLPQAELCVFDHVGHVLYAEAVDEIVQAITEWIHRHPLTATQPGRDVVTLAQSDH
jgi:pimeloyl-ACP methyl ester carboxylesterase